ncbi:MAG: hypothetical protein B6D68_02700 [spirochete symbiont of Stewartia floridana]|nr:MAG: hypothetical protein B6D68_02700 [spirochete symbiont of Stewartia floridana]
MILAVDLGTCSLKAGLLSFDGDLKHRIRVPYSNSPVLKPPGFDPLQWEWAFREALKRLPANRIAAVAISGNGPSLVACDGQGVPLTSALLWLQNDGKRIEGTESFYLPKAASLKAYDGGTVLKKARWLLSPPEWLQFRLTGRPTMTIPHESFRPYVWTPSQIDAYGLEERLFPEIVTMGTIIGEVSREPGALSGLLEGVPVVSVGTDYMAALLGSGTAAPGMVCDRAGTSEGINYCTEIPSGDPRIRDLPHLVEGLWNAAIILASTGTVFEWYRRLTGQEHKPYEVTLSEVDELMPGGREPLFFPSRLEDVFWVFTGGSLHRLEPGHGPAQIGRAVMESIGYGVRRGIEILESAGMKVEEMRVTGGQARGDVWNQMKADITGCRLIIPEIEDAELAGCAACALSALRFVDNPLEGADLFVRTRKIVEPRREFHECYDTAYARYWDAAAALGYSA